jgi:hypothetical protein
MPGKARVGHGEGAVIVTNQGVASQISKGYPCHAVLVWISGTGLVFSGAAGAILLGAAVLPMLQIVD